MRLPTSLRILVVDDHQAMRKTIGMILNQSGFTNIEYAENGAEALRRIRENAPEVVLLDWRMPDMDGLEVLQRIRKDPECAKTPVLMVSAVADRDLIVKAVMEGANNYVVKPFTPMTLLKKMETVLAA